MGKERKPPSPGTREEKREERLSEGNVFSERLREQKSLTTGPGAVSDINPLSMDPNPILDTGCPRNVGGIDYAVAMCNALGIHFDLEPLDCDPFYHGYGMKCSEAKLEMVYGNSPSPISMELALNYRSISSKAMVTCSSVTQSHLNVRS